MLDLPPLGSIGLKCVALGQLCMQGILTSSPGFEWKDYPGKSPIQFLSNEHVNSGEASCQEGKLFCSKVVFPIPLPWLKTRSTEIVGGNHEKEKLL